MDPNSKLTASDIGDIAGFARIALTDEKKEQFANELNEVLASMQSIREMNLDGVEPTFQPIEGLVNVFREDEVVEPLAQDVALQNSDSTEDGAFLIPTILGGGDDA